MESVQAGNIRIPKIGLGTWPMRGEQCREAVLTALELGYRHIDTATAYGNEDAIGAALAESGLPRAAVHLTSKIWWDQLSPEGIARSVDASLKALRTDHTDLHLLHWPAPGMDLAACLDALTRCKEEGKVRAIGVANFPMRLLREAVETVAAPIACLQVEYHALLGQDALLNYCRARHIGFTAYTPLGRGRVVEEKTIIDIAARLGVGPTQVALAWLFGQDGVIAAPRSTRREGMKANLEALSIRLSPEDRAAIDALPKNVRCVSPDFAPQWD